MYSVHILVSSGVLKGSEGVVRTEQDRARCKQVEIPLQLVTQQQQQQQCSAKVKLGKTMP